MKLFTVISLLLMSSFQAKAIRFVGSGGGDAELKVISYLESLPTWLNFCSVGSSDCVKGVESSFWKSFSIQYQNLQITEVEFVNQSQFDQRILVKSSAGYKLVLTFESLYVDNKVSKEDNQLFIIVLDQIFKTMPIQSTLLAESILILPNYKKHPVLGLYAFRVNKENKLYAPYFDLNAQLIGLSELNSFKIISETATGYIIQNLQTMNFFEIVISTHSKVTLYPVFN